MKHIFQIGDQRTHQFTPSAHDMAAFEGAVVHAVCSTFALAREMEWTGRLFVLEMKEAHEEGIGTTLQITHLAPAALHIPVECIGYFEGIEKEEIKVRIEVRQNGRWIARASTGQKILPKDVLKRIFQKSGIAHTA